MRNEIKLVSGLILLIITSLTFQQAYSLSLIAYSFEDLNTKSDHIVIGTVTITRKMSTQKFYEVEIEKSFNNTIEDTTIQILSEEIFSDYPDFRSKLSNGKYLLYLSDTGTEYRQCKVFEVFGVTQGAFRVEDGIASNGLFNIIVDEDELRVADEGKIVFHSIDFPDDMTVYDFREIHVQFHNVGGQRTRNNFNVSFVGVSESSLGDKINKQVQVAASAGRSTGANIELNVSKNGSYGLVVNESYVKDVFIHKVGYGADGYNFSNIRLESSDLDWSTYKVVFDVSSGISEYNEVYYRMVVSDGAGTQFLNVPMLSRFDGVETKSNWYNFGRNSMGVRKVVIWYKGLRVLETIIDLGTGEETISESDEVGGNRISGFPSTALFVGVVLIFYLNKKTCSIL